MLIKFQKINSPANTIFNTITYLPFVYVQNYIKVHYLEKYLGPNLYLRFTLFLFSDHVTLQVNYYCHH